MLERSPYVYLDIIVNMSMVQESFLSYGAQETFVKLFVTLCNSAFKLFTYAILHVNSNHVTSRP